jgi:GAF domain-containing protein
LAHRNRKEFAPAELEFLTNLARQAAIAIQNARLFEQAETRAEELATLNQLAQSLSSQLNINQIIDTIYSGISRLIDAKNFYIGFYDAVTNEILFPQNVSESDLDRDITRLPMGQGITSYMIQTGESVLITDGSEKWMQEKGIETAGAPAKSFLGVPLTRGGHRLGAMAVQSYDQYNAYDQHDLQPDPLAGQVAVAGKRPPFPETQNGGRIMRCLAHERCNIVYDKDGRYAHCSNQSIFLVRLLMKCRQVFARSLTARITSPIHDAIHQPA